MEILVDIFILIFWFGRAKSYPESGLHVSLAKKQPVNPKEWTLLKGWSTNQVIGSFMQDFRILTTSDFIIPRSGLYFVSLHLFFDNEVSISNINISINNRNYVSKYNKTRTTKDIHIYETIRADYENLLKVFVHPDSFNTLSTDTSISMQFISTLETSVGFSANPITRTINRNVKSQPFLYWESQFNIINGFSLSTGRFNVIYDGYYLVTLKLIVKNIIGSLEVSFVKNDLENTIINRKYSKRRNLYDTIFYTNVEKLKKFDDLSLRIFTNQRGGSIQSDSIYSVTYLRQSASEDAHYARNVESPEKIWKNFNWYRIEKWLPKLSVLKTIQINANGYYFVTVRVDIKTTSSNDISVRLLINNIEKTVVTETGFFGIHRIVITSVYFMKMQDGLNCEVRTKSGDVILRSSFYTITKVKFVNQTALFSIAEPVNNVLSETGETDNKTGISDLKALFGPGKFLLTSEISNTIFSIIRKPDKKLVEIKRDGHYFITVNFAQKNNSFNQSNLFIAYKEVSSWNQVARLKISASQSVFYSTILTLKRGGMLGIYRNNPIFDCNNCIEASMEILLLQIFPNSIGASLVFSERQSSKSTYISSFQKSNQVEPEYDCVTIKNDKLKIDQSGVYSIIVNLNINLTEPKNVKFVRLNIGLSSGSSRTSTIHELKKTVSENLLSFHTNLVHKIEADEHLSVKLIYFERGTTEKFIDGEISVLLLHTNESAILVRQADVTNEIQSSGMISWKTKFSEIFYYFSVMIDIRVQHTMLALLATTVNGKITVDRPSKRHILKATIQVNKKPIYHLTTSYQQITESRDVSLSISGLVTLQQEDYVYVHISLTDGLTLRLSKQTRIFMAVLDETFEQSKNFSDIQAKFLDIPNDMSSNKEILIKDSGVYQIEFDFKGVKYLSRKRRQAVTRTSPQKAQKNSTDTRNDTLPTPGEHTVTKSSNQASNYTRNTTNITEVATNITEVDTTNAPMSPMKSANANNTKKYTTSRHTRSVGKFSSFPFTTKPSLLTSTPITRPKDLLKSVIVYQSDKSILDDKNIVKLHNKVTTIWSDAIFNFSCIYCIQKIRILTYLQKGKILRTTIPKFTIGLTKIVDNDKGFSTKRIPADFYLCGNEKQYDYIMWPVKESSFERFNYFFQADSYGMYFAFANIIVDDPLQESTIRLVVNSNMESSIRLQRTQLSRTQSLHQISYEAYVKYGGLLQLMVQCPNMTVQVLTGALVSVYKSVSLFPGFQESLPVYNVQPFPLFNENPRKINYTCGFANTSLNDQIVWKRTEIYSGLESTFKRGPVISFQGIPKESGHYFCRLDYYQNEDRIIPIESNAITFQISDDDECFLMTLANNTKIKKCDNNSECINSIGSYSCQCYEGYTGDGFVCEDINECLSDPCGNFSECINEPGNYRCECMKGYRGYKGLNCTDIDECVENGPDFCEKQLKSDKARCRNYPGTYECYCIEGYEKKGGRCQDVNECESDPADFPCNNHATCFNTEGSFYCRCDAGWFGNGTYCEDVDECKNKTAFQCAGNATCVNEPGSYRCICKRGFRGEGKIKCVPLGCFPPPYCSGQYSASWWARKPYIENGTKQEEAFGLFRDIISIIITDICNNCSQLVFNPPLNDSTAVEITVEQNITDIACPLYGSKEQEKFRGFPFIPIVEAPGVAFFVKEKERENNPLIGSLAGSWPILVITLLLASLSGVIIWFLDTVRNPKEFPHSFLEGSWEGFWWAFITMTTVGYGDKAPRSFFARVFGILWILIGLVIISTFTATITTVLTASSLSNTVKLYGTRVGALANSEEFRLGVKRNADVIGYRTVTEIINALNNGDIQGALLDTYIAGEFQESLSNYKLQEILEHVFVYGLTLARDAENLEEKFRSYMERRQSSVYAIISKVVKPLKENKATKATGGSTATLFDAKSPFFVKMLVGGSVILLALLFLGFLWDWFYWRNKNRSVQKILNGTVPEAVHVSWQTCDIIEYQKRSFRKEVSDMKSQITNFTELWLTKLNDLEAKHEHQLSKVQKWLGKSNLLNTIRHYPASNSTFGNFGEKEQKTDFLKLYQNDKDDS